MGCAQSKIEQEEAVMRCKNRRRLMADAVAARNHFAAAHSAYTILLKTTGGALSDYARGEAPDPSSSSSAVAAASMSAPPAASTAVLPPAPRDNLSPPPPPPFADFSPGSLQRSSSTPIIPIPDPKASRKPPAGAAIREEGDGEDEDEDEDGHIRTDSDDDDYNDDDEDDHHEHDDVDVDEVAHGHRKGNMDSMASSPAVTPQPPPQLNPSPPTPASTPPLPISQGMGTWDYFFGTEPMTPPTLAQHDEEPWMGRREQDAAPEVETPPPMRPIPKLVVNDETVEERPRTALEKAKAMEELAAQLPPSKPIVKKPPKPPVLPPVVQYQHAASMVSTEARKGKIVVASGTANLMQTVAQLDDQFLKASESAYEVSKNLEATRMHYHSNHADSRGHIDHSAKIMHVITWNRSFKNLPGHDDMNDNFETDERFETHATILDKMLAWEKKLYDEVKAGELMKIDYQKKVALLHKQKKRGVKHEILEKTKAAVSHLHTRYIVDMQSMDSTVSEINRLRDKQLYPKLVDLVDGMAKMWNAMSHHHKKQFKIILGIRSFDIPPVSRETSDLHFKQTSDLHDFVMEWHSQFEKLMTHQKEYIRALNAWLKLNLIPIESSLKEKVSSPPRQVEPPIKDLLHAWQDQLERLPIELAKNAIKSFAEVINNILRLQEEEVDLRRRCEGTRRDLNRRIAQFEDWHRKYLERRASQGEDANPEDRETLNPDPVVGRKIAVQEVEIRLKEEQEHHRKFAAQVREKSLANLRVHLPDLFRNMADFASFCGDMYIDLKISAAQLKDEVEG